MQVVRFCRPCGREVSRALRRQKVGVMQSRNLSIHEYQAQGVLREAGVPVPRGSLARTVEEAQNAASLFEGSCVLKSQVLAGGRGKGSFSESGLKGGIQIVQKPQEASSMSQKMLGNRLVTKQTSSAGLLVDKLYVTEKLKYVDEYYLAITIDRANCCPAIIVSKQGGMNIEEVAKNDPASLTKIRFQYSEGITPSVIAEACAALSLTGAAATKMSTLLTSMYAVFVAKDATLLEINPLVRTEAEELVCLDAKFSFDNSAASRQPALFALRDKSQEQGDELEAERAGLVYVRLDGNIGNVVNGAGLAMATNDAVSFYGGKSANFLDAGGKATKETMVKAFEIILRDQRVTAIFVNIYGGLTKCDMIATSIIDAAAQLGPMRVPVVVRLQGTNAEEGQKMIAESGLDLIAEHDFGKAAQAAVEKAGRYMAS